MFLDGLLLSNPLLRRTKNTAPIYFFIQQVVLSANVFHNNVYFFIHAVGLFYILPYTQSDSRPTSFRTTYIFSYTQSVTCIFLHTHDRRLSGQRIFFHTHNRTLVYFFIHTVGLITAGPRKVNFPFKILLWKLHFRTNRRPDVEKSIFLLKSFYKKLYFRTDRGVGITAGPRKVNFPFKIPL